MIGKKKREGKHRKREREEGKKTREELKKPKGDERGTNEHK
jgi:hypothetical protein